MPKSLDEIFGPQGDVSQPNSAHAKKSLNEIFGEPASSKPSMAGSAYRGIEQGVTAGLGDEAKSSIGALYAKVDDAVRTHLMGQEPLLKDKSVGELVNDSNTQQNEQLKQDFETNPAPTIAGNIVGTLLTGGAAAGTKAGNAVTNAVREGNFASRLVKGAAVGAGSGAISGAGTAENGNRIEGAIEGAKMGGTVGAVLPVAGKVISGAAKAVIPEVKAGAKDLAQRARDLGIPLRIDQIAPSRTRNTIQKVSQELPFSGANSFDESQRQSFTKALARTIGQDSENLGPETIKKYLDDSGEKFKSALGDEPITFDENSLSRFDEISNKAKTLVTNDVARVVENNVNKFKRNLRGGVINGGKLASFRSELIRDIPSATGEAKKYLGDIVETIDDIAEKYLPEEAAATLKQARREYRNFKTIEPLLEKSTNGQINPTELLNRVKASKYIKAARSEVGQDDLVDLARIGKEFLPQKGGSDTFQKSVIGGSAGGLGITAISNPLVALGLAAKGGAVLGTNRAFQKGYNQSQKIVDKVINSADKNTKAITPILAAPAGAIAGEAAGREVNDSKPLKVNINKGNSYIPDNQIKPAEKAYPGVTAPAAKTVGPQSQNQPTLLNKIAQAESGGNPNAKATTSSASGLYQFTNGTWRKLVSKYGNELGIAYKDKSDPQKQTILAEKLLAENNDYLQQKLNREPTDGELYIAHFLGAPKAARLISVPNKELSAARIFPEEAKANHNIFYKDGKPLTIAAVYELLTKKVA